jgi:hypothetical protein
VGLLDERPYIQQMSMCEDGYAFTLICRWRNPFSLSRGINHLQHRIRAPGSRKDSFNATLPHPVLLRMLSSGSKPVVGHMSDYGVCVGDLGVYNSDHNDIGRSIRLNAVSNDLVMCDTKAVLSVDIDSRIGSLAHSVVCDYSLLEFTPYEVALFREQFSVIEAFSRNARCYRLLLSCFGKTTLAKQMLSSAFDECCGPIHITTLYQLLGLVSSAHSDSFGHLVALWSTPVFDLSRVDDFMMHVDARTRKITFYQLLVLLGERVERDVWVGMEAATMISMSMATNAANMASGHASKAFEAEVKATPKVSVILSVEEKRSLQRLVGFCPLFENKLAVDNDHRLLYACRELARASYERSSNCRNVNTKTLVVGSSWREVSNYMSNPNIDHYFFCGDGKDMVRTTIKALEEAAKVKWKVMRAAEKAEVRKRETDVIAPKLDDVVVSGSSKKHNVDTYLGMKGLLKQAKEESQVPGRFLFDVVNYTNDPTRVYSSLLFEDVGYNFSERNWLELFGMTNAMVGYGYMALPFELLFDNMPITDKPIYRYNESKAWFFERSFNPEDGSSNARGKLSVTSASMSGNFSNGYEHPKGAWSLMLKKPLWTHSAFSFALEVEITSRMGPMVCFTITRRDYIGAVVRTIALPEDLEYVQLMDLVAVSERMKSKGYYTVCKPYPYFSVRKAEVLALQSYLLSLDVKSLDLTNAMAYVRKMQNGASLVEAKLAPKWDLRGVDMPKFVVAVYHSTLFLRAKLYKDVDQIITIELDWKEKIKNILKRTANTILEPMSFIWSWLYTSHLADQIIIDMPNEHFQRAECGSGPAGVSRLGSDLNYSPIFSEEFHIGEERRVFHPNHIERFDVERKDIVGPKIDEVIGEKDVAEENPIDEKKDFTYVDFNFEDSKFHFKGANPLLSFLKGGGKLRNDVDLHKALLDFYNWRMEFDDTTCSVCKTLQGKTGAQIVECYHTGGPTVHTFSMTQTEVCDLRNKLKEDALKAPAGLAKTFEDTHKILPTDAFSIDAEVEYIKGGPGCGKSYIIRAMADPMLNLIAAPFLKLRSDYQQVEMDGRKVDYRFHTQHKACQETGSSTVYVDEFTALDYQLLCVIVRRCGATKVIIVGDEQQTGILESAGEGINILNRIDVPSVNRHEPIVNFRNPPHTVRLLNYLYGYTMIPASKSKGKISFGSTLDFQDMSVLKDTTLMHYSWATHDVLLCTDEDNKRDSKTTVRSNQGSTWENVILPVTEYDSKLILNDSLNIVALSRHKGNLDILLEGGEHCSPQVGTIKQLVEGVPEAVSRDDYVLRLFLGLETARDCAPKRDTTSLRKEFKELVDLFDGYVPYDEEWPKQEVISIGSNSELNRGNTSSFGSDSKSSEVPPESSRSGDSSGDENEDMRQNSNQKVERTSINDKIENWNSAVPTVDDEGTQPLLPVSSMPTNVEMTVQRPVFFSRYTLSERPNNCLALALSDALPLSRTDLDTTMKNHSLRSAEFYKRWLDTSRMSTILDLAVFAEALSVCVTVKLVNGDAIDKGQTIKCGVMGAREVVILYDNETKHYYHDKSLRPKKESFLSSLLNSSEKSKGRLTDRPVVEHIWKHGQDLMKVLEFYDCNYAAFAVLNDFLDNNGPKLISGAVYKFLPSNKKLYGIDLREGGARLNDNQVLVPISEDLQADSFNDFGLRHTYMEYVNEYIPKSTSSFLAAMVEDKGRVQEVRHTKPARDSYLLTARVDYSTRQHYDLNFLNEETQTMVGSKFVTGSVDMGFLTPVNQRGHPKTNTVRYKALTTGPALVYLKNSQWQTLQVLQDRYLSNATSSMMSIAGVNTAKYIADLFVDECMDPNMDFVLDDEALAELQLRAYGDMRIRNYQKQMNELDQAGANVCRFQLKDIEKVGKDSINIAKAGQGIAAWSKVAQTKFMIPFRALNAALLKSLKPNVVYDNSYSEEEFMQKANVALGNTPAVAVNGVIDATACDAGQNAFTQQIERYIIKRFGISDEFLDRYFSFRASYILQSDHLRAHVKNIKTSGEPGTLFGNSILMAALMNALLRGEGPWAMLMKGDDGVKRQANLHYNPILVKAIKENCSLDFKLDIDVPMQFCGYALVSGMLVPCVERKLAKIATHKFKTKEHFQEYQISLRDWVNRVPTDPEKYAIFMSANAEVSGVSYDLIESLFEQIVSWSRISGYQFDSEFEDRVVVVDEQPTDYSLGPVDTKAMKFATAWAPRELGKHVT